MRNEQILEAASRLKESGLSFDIIFNRHYSDNDNEQKAFLDGYAVGMLSSLLVTGLENCKDEVFSESDKDLLVKAIGGDKEAISLLKERCNETEI